MFIFQDEKCNLFKNAIFNFNKDSYIVSLDGNIIGHFNIIRLGDDISLEYELLPKYQNRRLGNLFLKGIEEYINNNFDFNKLLLLIKYDNKKSINVAINNGYQVDYSLTEKILETGEMSMYIPYFKNKQKNKSINLK